MNIVFSGCVLIVPTAHCHNNALSVRSHRKDILAQGNTRTLIDGALEELVEGRGYGGHQHDNETDIEHDRYGHNYLAPPGKFCFVSFLGSSPTYNLPLICSVTLSNQIRYTN